MGLRVLIQSAQCAGNTHDEDRLCDEFFWRDDLEAPNKSGKQLCSGPGITVKSSNWFVNRHIHRSTVHILWISFATEHERDADLPNKLV